MAVKVLWDGEKLILSQPQHPHRIYPQLDRLCAKLKRRGYRIQRTGVGELRYAWPVKARYGYPKALFTVGLPVLWDG